MSFDELAFAFVSTPAACFLAGKCKCVEPRRPCSSEANRRVLLGFAARRLAAPVISVVRMLVREATCRCAPPPPSCKCFPFRRSSGQGRGRRGLRRCRGDKIAGTRAAGRPIAFQPRRGHIPNSGRAQPWKDVRSKQTPKSPRGVTRLPNEPCKMSNAPTTNSAHF